MTFCVPAPDAAVGEAGILVAAFALAFLGSPLESRIVGHLRLASLSLDGRQPLINRLRTLP